MDRAIRSPAEALALTHRRWLDYARKHEAIYRLHRDGLEPDQEVARRARRQAIEARLFARKLRVMWRRVAVACACA